MKRELLPSTAFIRATKRLDKKNRPALAAIRETLTVLQNDAFDPRLATHKLKGDLAGLWACSTGYDLRIVFEIVDHNGTAAVLLISCGTHAEVY